MIIRAVFIVLVVFVVTDSVSGQFLQFTFQVDTEASAGVLQELNFGLISSNMSRIINPDDPNSGWFQIVVLNAAQLQIDFHTPQNMVLESNPDCEEDWCMFPIRLGFAYFVTTNPMARAPENLISMSEGANFINLSDFNVAGITDSYIYVNVNVFGEISLGEVNPGVYTGELLLEVIY